MEEDYLHDWSLTVDARFTRAQNVLFKCFDDGDYSKSDKEEEKPIEGISSTRVHIDRRGFFLIWEIAGVKTLLLDLSTVWEIRTKNPPADVLRRILMADSSVLGENTIWISHGSLAHPKNLVFVSRNSDIAQDWCAKLNEIVLFHSNKRRFISPNTSIIKSYLRLCLATNKRRELHVENVINFFKSTGLSKSIIHDHFTVGNLLQFTFDNFLKLLSMTNSCPKIEHLIEELSIGAENLTVEELAKFLSNNKVSGVTVDLEYAQDLISKHETDQGLVDTGKLSRGAFVRLLQSEEFSSVSLNDYDRKQEMDHPLCDYYINSSHNSYLCGAQIRGESSSEIYRTLLLSGVRCIELDTWNGTGKYSGQPVITHGYAGCSIVLFEDVIRQIRDTAFIRSQCPVILSIENHCSTRYQQKMVEIMRETLRPYLLEDPLPAHPLSLNQLPSPELLNERILVMMNRLPVHEEKLRLEELERSQSNENVAAYEKKPLLKRESSAEENRDIDPMLSKLVNYTQQTTFKSFEDSNRSLRPHHAANMKEDDAKSLIKKEMNEFIAFNSRQLTRVYPNGRRFTSSNLDPPIFWRAGCQVLAMNHQRYDSSTLLNNAMFEFNDCDGFILKPKCLRNSVSPSDSIPLPAECCIRVISGKFVLEKNVKTRVEVEMIGHKDIVHQDRFMGMQKMKYAISTLPNGLFPVYENREFLFHVTNLQMAMLRFNVTTECNAFCGQRIIPVEYLLSGYRIIALRTMKDQVTDASLFVHIRVNPSDVA